MDTFVTLTFDRLEREAFERANVHLTLAFPSAGRPHNGGGQAEPGTEDADARLVYRLGVDPHVGTRDNLLRAQRIYGQLLEKVWTDIQYWTAQLDLAKAAAQNTAVQHTAPLNAAGRNTGDSPLSERDDPSRDEPHSFGGTAAAAEPAATERAGREAAGGEAASGGSAEHAGPASGSLVADRVQAIEVLLEARRAQHDDIQPALYLLQRALSRLPLPEGDSFIVVTGDPVNGFTYVGPFLRGWIAEDHACATYDSGAWWSVQLSPPSRDED